MARDLRLVAHEWIRELEISGLVNWLIGCSGYQENGEFRIGKLELRMDSVSKPALSPFGCAQGKLRRMGAE